MRCSHFSILAVLLLTANIAFAQNLTVQVTPINPPIQIPYSGGSFEFNLAVANQTTQTQRFDLWCSIIYPDSTTHLAIGPARLQLPGNASVNRNRTQMIDSTYATGVYQFTTYIGRYPSNIVDSDSFQFEKQILGGIELWVALYNGPDNGGDQANSLAVDGSGNVYVTGYSYTSGNNLDYATIKYNSAGVQEWVARYNGPGYSMDEAYSLAVDGSGNVYVTGSSYGSGTNRDYATIKYNSAGVQEWVARYNGPGNINDYAYSLAVDGSGNVYVTGRSYGSGTYDDYATIKYNSAGVQEWVARYNGPGNSYDYALSLAVDAAGNVYVTGYSAGSETDHDYATVKYNSAGVQQWVVRYNGPGNPALDEAYSLAVDGSGNVYVTGGSYGSGTYYDYATIKYNSAGVQEWVARYSGPGNSADRAYSLAVDGSGNVYVTGGSYGSGTYTDYTTIKYNSAGVQEWVARYNGPGNNYDDAYSLAVDGSSNVYVTGGSRGSGNDYDYATIKYNSAGVQEWVVRYNGPGNLQDEAYNLAVDAASNVYVTGYSGTISDYCTIKYSGGNLSGWELVTATVIGASVPKEFRLEQNYPNPFNATSIIRYQLPADSHVKLEVFDISGRLVTTLINGWREAGTHDVTFDASGLAAGVYVYRLQAGEYTGVEKMALVK